jgi:hypothetical protein
MLDRPGALRALHRSAPATRPGASRLLLGRDRLDRDRDGLRVHGLDLVADLDELELRRILDVEVDGLVRTLQRDLVRLGIDGDHVGDDRDLLADGAAGVAPTGARIISLAPFAEGTSLPSFFSVSDKASA